MGKMKLSLLDFGELTADPGWFLEANGAWTFSGGFPSKEVRHLQMVGAAIEHPKHGLILYEVGPVATWKEMWPAPVQQVFAVTKYGDENHLDAQLNRLGYSLSDVKGIIIGHMHLDHAGGIEHFRGTQVPIYAHEEEIKYSFYAIATKEDFGAYLPHYIDWSFNWVPIHADQLEIFEGITLHRTPGHTPGLMAIQVDLKDAGTFVLTSDTFFFEENYNPPHAPGWLIRDMMGWRYSLELIKSIEERKQAKVIFGHDIKVFQKYAAEKTYD